MIAEAKDEVGKGKWKDGERYSNRSGPLRRRLEKTSPFAPAVALIPWAPSERSQGAVWNHEGTNSNSVANNLLKPRLFAATAIPIARRAASRFCCHARPHPGPLPQERENLRRVLSQRQPSVLRQFSPANHQPAATGNPTSESSQRIRSLSLSPGERARVRASVTQILTQISSGEWSSRSKDPGGRILFPHSLAVHSFAFRLCPLAFLIPMSLLTPELLRRLEQFQLLAARRAKSSAKGERRSRGARAIRRVRRPPQLRPRRRFPLPRLESLRSPRQTFPQALRGGTRTARAHFPRCQRVHDLRRTAQIRFRPPGRRRHRLRGAVRL